MLFNSIEFLIFFPFVVLAYFIIPRKARMYWLLVTSYIFYMGWNPSYALLLLFSTAVTFLSGLLIGRARAANERAQINGIKTRNWAKVFVALSLTINFAVLFFFKYFDFAVDNVNAILGAIGREAYQPKFDVLLPVGISFYIFQALSYTMDVYRGDVRVEKNFFKYATFVSFFPQLVAGPIERSSNLLLQFDEPKSFDAKRARDGLMMMLWGFFLKIVIADRAALVADQVFNYPSYYSGAQIFVAALLFAVQIYGDFAGYSSIALGAAEVMGFSLMENFRRPYFAQSVSEFWRRWHISLSSWFRDYLYFPLGGSRKGKWCTYRNILIVFLVSGLWHGAAWTYVVWGAINGLYQIIGAQTKKLRERCMSYLQIRTDTFSHKVLRILITFFLINISWFFFRASSITTAFSMIKSMLFSFNPWVFFDGSLLNMGLDQTQWIVLLLAVATLFTVSILQERGIRLRETIGRQATWFRWLLYLTAIFTVLIFGRYGPAVESSAFIYFQF